MPFVVYILKSTHLALVKKVNESKTQREHDLAEAMLRGFRDGVEAAGARLDLIAADLLYLDQGIDRPMTCGVWLDWMPEPTSPTGQEE